MVSVCINGCSLSLGQPVLGTQTTRLELWRPLHERAEGEEPLAVITHDTRYVRDVIDT